MSEDPIRDGNNWYTYAINNPVRFVDPSGKEAQEWFKSEEEAAKDFGMTYNNLSIEEQVEYGTFIYDFVVIEERLVGDLYIPVAQLYFSYMIPVKGSKSEIDILNNIDFRATQAIYSNARVCASIHTHGNYDKKYDNDEFSLQDKLSAISMGFTKYVVTPGGFLYKFTIKGAKVQLISKDMPIDKNHPRYELADHQ